MTGTTSKKNTRPRGRRSTAAPANEQEHSAAGDVTSALGQGVATPVAAAEIAELRATIQSLQAAADAARQQAVDAQAQLAQAQLVASPPSAAPANVAAIERPHGDAGRDFNLQGAMGLGEDQDLYRSIQRTVKHAAIQAGIDLHSRFRAIPVEKLANIYKKRFPGDWPTIELLKQFLKNHRKHDRKTGRLEPYKKVQQAKRAAPRSLANIDNDDEPTGSDD
ncbi:hypothetical protein MD484_g409, partial [Candolleomyces efflorescens]